MGIIKADDLVFDYIRRDEEGNVENVTEAVDHVSLDVEQGQFIAILGHNGSGKSTLAKHINAILKPTEGEMTVDGMSTSEEDNVWSVRQTAGMVISKSGQPDCSYNCRRRCSIRTGKSRCTDGRNLGKS